jgi:uncharacterized membrane protein
MNDEHQQIFISDPWIGMLGSITSVGSTILSYVGVISTLVGLLAGIGGLVIVIYTIIHMSHRLKMDKLEEIKKRTELEKYGMWNDGWWH